MPAPRPRHARATPAPPKPKKKCLWPAPRPRRARATPAPLSCDPWGGILYLDKSCGSRSQKGDGRMQAPLPPPRPPGYRNL
eukprot:gene23407-biopygen4327